MSQSLRRRVSARLGGEGEAGFTLIELLVVMLILGILAAIALPAFFNQKSKADDAKAKEYAHTAQVAMETCSTDNSGAYVELRRIAALKAIEPTLIRANGLAIAASAASSYVITSAATGSVTRFLVATFAIDHSAATSDLPVHDRR